MNGVGVHSDMIFTSSQQVSKDYNVLVDITIMVVKRSVILKVFISETRERKKTKSKQSRK